VKFFLKYGVLLIGMLWIMKSEVFAFSIDSFQVRSQFGEKLNASFEIHLDFNGPVEVGLGDLDDYTKVGLEREDIIDALTLDLIESGDKLSRIVKIHSNNPLFFPSLNLVVWATHNGGTLLENFLVTVNFQQGLALNVRVNKKKNPHKQHPKYSPEFALSQKNALRLYEKDEPSVEKEQRVRPKSKTTDFEVADNNSPPEKSIEPVPVKTGVMHRRGLSGVIWANPRPNPILATEKIEKKVDALDLTVSKEEYVLLKGERLFSVARKFKVGDYHPAQIAATIWLHNIDKFMLGNIHGILEGAKLSLKNLEEHVSGIDLQMAGDILKNQAVEWKLIKGAPSNQEEIATISEVPLPSERLEGLDDLLTELNGWQATWEKMDIEGHLDYYQSLKIEKSVLSNKKQLMARYPKPNLQTFSKFIALKKGVPIVFFTQVFLAEKLKSWGLKELEWARTGSGWKICGENFYESFSRSGEQSFISAASFGSRINPVKTLPFVIHVSSHSNKFSTLSLTNRLRKQGFDAYWVPVRMSADTFIYRVYVGRFSDLQQTDRFVQILRKNSFSSHATAIPYPFALQVGEANSLKESRILLEYLRKFGFSGLLLVSFNEPIGANLRVIVGAFKNEDNAKWILKKLKQFGFAAKLISP
jgi:hypothetical protein